MNMERLESLKLSALRIAAGKHCTSCDPKAKQAHADNVLLRRADYHIVRTPKGEFVHAKRTEEDTRPSTHVEEVEICERLSRELNNERSLF